MNIDVPLTRYLLLLVSAPAVLLGIFAMRASGVQTRIWALNLATWLSAVLMTLALKPVSRPLPRGSFLRVMVLGLCVLALVATFWFRSLEGVHRWLIFGPIRLHASAVLVPILLIEVASILDGCHSWAACALIFSIAALLAFQPDAAQEAAFVASAFVLLVRPGKSSAAARFTIAGLPLTLSAGLLIPDRLPSIAHVEGIIRLARAVNPALSVVCIFALTLLPTPFLLDSWQWKGHTRSRISFALAIYFGITCLAPAAGNFPVPLMGYGAGPIIGYFIASAWLFLQDAEDCRRLFRELQRPQMLTAARNASSISEADREASRL